MSATCTITYASSHSMAAPSFSTSPYHSRRYNRAQSSPANPAPSSSFSTSTASTTSSSTHSSNKSTADSMADSVNKLAALPSLSKSLNHLPSLAGQSSKQVPVYEGMPSVAQKSSHEKLRTAMGKSSSQGRDSAANDKKGFYGSPFFSMTPMASGLPPTKAASYPQRSSKTFSIYSDSDDNDDDMDA